MDHANTRNTENGTKVEKPQLSKDLKKKTKEL
jgi:hypothetical protein